MHFIFASVVVQVEVFSTVSTVDKHQKINLPFSQSGYGTHIILDINVVCSGYKRLYTLCAFIACMGSDDAGEDHSMVGKCAGSKQLFKCIQVSVSLPTLTLDPPFICVNLALHELSRIGCKKGEYWILNSSSRIALCMCSVYLEQTKYIWSLLKKSIIFWEKARNNLLIRDLINTLININTSSKYKMQL